MSAATPLVEPPTLSRWLYAKEKGAYIAEVIELLEIQPLTDAVVLSSNLASAFRLVSNSL